MARRTVLLVVAILVAALGTLLVSLYAHNVDKRALAKQHPRSILIAKKVIASGTTGAQAAQDGALQLTPVASDAIADGALSDISAVASQVALAPIYPGEQILRQKFGKAGASTALSIPDPGTMAVSVSFGDPARVDGFVVPGSEVAVFVTADKSTRLLLPRAKVIAIGTRTLVPSSGQGGQGGQQSPASVVTFEVSEADAQKLIYAQTSGQLYLALLTKDSTTDGKLPATNASNLFG